jgi:hypothetical protein
MEKSKINYCTPQGTCDCPDDDKSETACAHYTASAIKNTCVYRIMHADKCMSPFALLAAREAA